MKHPETHLCTPEHGPRPAGRPDECFFCHVAVGSTHKPDCVLRLKTVMMRYSFEIPVLVPEFWPDETTMFHRNEGSWCANNALTELQGVVETKVGCLCGVFEAEFLREASEQDDVNFGVGKLNDTANLWSHR